LFTFDVRRLDGLNVGGLSTLGGKLGFASHSVCIELGSSVINGYGRLIRINYASTCQ
jgi:hypothetical protein